MSLIEIAKEMALRQASFQDQKERFATIPTTIPHEEIQRVCFDFVRAIGLHEPELRFNPSQITNVVLICVESAYIDPISYRSFIADTGYAGHITSAHNEDVWLRLDPSIPDDEAHLYAVPPAPVLWVPR